MYRVYMITGPSGKRYIGKTRWSVQRRWGEHVRFAGIKNPHTRTWHTALSRAIRKYGADAFAAVDVYECVDNREACAVEKGLVAQYGTFGHGGYNLTVGGEGADGYRHSPEMIAHLSAIKRGKQPRLGTKHSPETIALYREQRAGRKDLSPEGRLRLGHGKTRGRKRSASEIENWKASRAASGYDHGKTMRKIWLYKNAMDARGHGPHRPSYGEVNV